MMPNMSAVLVFDERIDLSDTMFVEIIAWKVPQPVRGNSHFYKYSFALVVENKCVLRYDNEAGKGDHKHIGRREEPIIFADLKTLRRAFFADVDRWRLRS